MVEAAALRVARFQFKAAAAQVYQGRVVLVLEERVFQAQIMARQGVLAVARV
jgi:hypothetical protein